MLCAELRCAGKFFWAWEVIILCVLMRLRPLVREGCVNRVLLASIIDKSWRREVFPVVKSHRAMCAEAATLADQDIVLLSRSVPNFPFWTLQS